MKKMKKISIILIILVIIVSTVFTAACSSKPNEVYYPKLEEIINATVKLSGCEQDAINIEKDDLEKFYSYLISSKPYSKSNYDHPRNAESYYTIRCATDKEIYIFYVFTKRMNTFIEKPYTGIYKTSIDAEDMFAKYFEN